MTIAHASFVSDTTLSDVDMRIHLSYNTASRWSGALNIWATCITDWHLSLLLRKRRSKTHTRLKDRFLMRRNRTKCANFQGKSLFQAMYNNTMENSQTNLSFVRLMPGSWREEKGMKLPASWHLFIIFFKEKKARQVPWNCACQLYLPLPLLGVKCKISKHTED